MSIIDKARSDRRIASLLKSVQQQAKIKFEKSKESRWSSSLEGDRAVIAYAGSRHPSAALARELLRLDIQMAGYRRIKLGISSVIDNEPMPDFISALDGELQHHKIYAKFIEMGFQPDQFYNESDEEIYLYLHRFLSAPPEKLSGIVPYFLTCVTPGGSMPLETHQALYDRFLRLNDGLHIKQLLTIEQLMKDWSNAHTLDQTETVKKIMLTIQPTANFSWFGFRDETGFPDLGFFIDEAFSVRLLPTGSPQ